MADFAGLPNKYEDFFKEFVENLRIGSGVQATGLCPFHQDKKPSFSVNLATGLWICHACGARGDIKKFAERLGVPLSLVPGMTTRRFFHGREFLPALLAQEILKYDKFIACPIDVGGKGVKLFVYMNGIFRRDGDEYARRQAHSLLGEDSKEDRIDAAIQILKEDRKIDLGQVDKEARRFINVDNGMLDWQEGSLLKHGEQYLSTLRINALFDPSAKSHAVEQFLREIFPPDALPLAEEMIGLLLIPETKYQMAFMLVGGGANGKSTFLDMVANFVGEDNLSRISLQDLSRNKFRLAELQGKLVNIYSDLAASAVQETDLFKMVVAGDTVTAERKFGQPFKFRPVARLLFSANTIPISGDRTEAFFRRWVIIPFPNKFEGKRADRELLKKLITREATSALLNHALIGLRRLEKNGGFTIPASVRGANEDYRNRCDNAHEFLTSKIYVSKGNTLSKVELYERYRLYCTWSGDKSIERQKEFNNRVQDMFNAVEAKVGTIRAWRGIAWKTGEGA